LIEETFDWYAQDKAGTVWYFGEDSKEYEDGVVVSTEGSWEAGVDGAVQGIVMPAAPAVGDVYNQEYYPDHAEDTGEVVSLTATVVADSVTYTNCVKTKDTNPLEDPVEVEYKYYAAGVGLVAEADEDDEVEMELTDVSTAPIADSPVIDPADFVAGVDNEFFPLVPGTTYTYQLVTDEGTEDIVVVVTNDTRVVMGVTCMVVRDTVRLDGELTEDTFDWYAQDTDGNVWYFGEDSSEYEGGVVVSTAGSWEAGVDGAEPGIIMLADPQVGDWYREEYYEGEAEDMAEIVSLDESVTVPNGSYDDCLKIRDWNPLDPENVVEYKWYAAGIGVIMEQEVGEPDEQVKLISITTE